jgi:hypothetical protein
MHTAPSVQPYHQEHPIRELAITPTLHQWQDTFKQDTIQAGEGNGWHGVLRFGFGLVT